MSVPVGEPSAPVPPPAADAAAEEGTAPAAADTPATPSWSERLSGRRSRRATYAVLVLVGIELGLIGAFLSLQVLHVAGRALPVGPVIAVAANLVTGLWAVRITRSRTAGIAPAVGWLGTVLLLSTSRGEGDLVITNSGRGAAFLLLGALGWAAAAAGARRLAPAQPSFRANTTTLSR